MYRFYMSDLNEDERIIRLKGEDYNHIKNVLRMRVGEQIIICNGQGIDFCCSITDISGREICTEVISKNASSGELPVKITLFQGLPKKDKMELIIQKAVELGVHKIVPVITKRTVVKLDDEKKEGRKVERWNTIAESAAKQSGRGIIPYVAPPISFKEAIESAKSLDRSIIPYEEAEGIEFTAEKIHEISEKYSAGVFIGPEGGFEITEIEEAKKAGIEPVTLGKRILRTETAGMAVLSVIMFEAEAASVRRQG